MQRNSITSKYKRSPTESVFISIGVNMYWQLKLLDIRDIL